MFKIYDGRSEFYQWDLDRKIIVNDDTIKQVHFCNKTDDCSLVVETYQEDGITLANVPNVLLTTAWRIKVYGYTGDFTKHEACFKVNGRTKPADYIYTETETFKWETIEKQIGDIETALDKIIDIECEILGIPNFENPITFYLDGTAYTANEGMTWEELIDSPYCPTIWQECCQVENKLFLKGWDEGDYQVYVDNCCGPAYMVEFEGSNVFIQDTIIPDGQYTIV